MVETLTTALVDCPIGSPLSSVVNSKWMSVTGATSHSGAISSVRFWLVSPGAKVKTRLITICSSPALTIVPFNVAVTVRLLGVSNLMVIWATG